ncbi:hypothetical protein ACFL0L_00220 [Patescibacteria group bacterium]
MKKLFILPILVLGVVLVLSGCTKTVENKVEDSIEDSTGGQADVDLDDGSIRVETDDGTFEAGDDVSLPSGFPSDVHVYDGTITAASTTGDDFFVVSVQTSDSPSTVKNKYETELADDGWEVTSTLTLPTGITLGAEKGNRYVTVSAGEEDGDTFVTIGVSSTE